MNRDDIVTIIPSESLKTARLEALVGRKGRILEFCYRRDGSVSGVWMTLIGEPFLEEQEWFIPSNSFI